MGGIERQMNRDGLGPTWDWFQPTWLDNPSLKIYLMHPIVTFKCKSNRNCSEIGRPQYLRGLANLTHQYLTP